MYKNLTYFFAIVPVLFILFLNFSTANPVYVSNVFLESDTLGTSDTLVIDSTIVSHDTAGWDIEPVENDTICYNYREGEFEILAIYGSGTPPPFAWVKLGSIWYGPIPNNVVYLPNTHGYSSHWFNSRIPGGTFGLGCLYIKFTYSTNFYSSQSFIRRVCPCRDGIGIP